MSDKVVYSQPGYILHQQHYRETSLIIDVLTRDFGRLTLLAKGVRKIKSKTAGMLRPFSTLSLSFVGNASLKVLTHVEQTEECANLSGMALYCGFYINELIRSFLHQEDPHPEIYWDYQDCIAQLSQIDFTEAALRIFEIKLMENIGYGLQFGFDVRHHKPVDSNKKYLFNKDDGLVEDASGVFSGSALLAMEQKNFTDLSVLIEAKKLMRTVIDVRLQGKRLKSRDVINKIIKRL